MNKIFRFLAILSLLLIGATTITISQTVYGGIVSSSQIVASGVRPSSLSLSGVSGGNGSYTRQWQQSTDNSSWSNISGATGTSYSPPAVKNTGTSNEYRYYRVAVTSAGQTVNSSTVIITVKVATSNISITPSSNANYVIVSRPRTMVSPGTALTTTNSVIDVTYYDGLGRPKQNIAVGASSDFSRDIVQHVEYDRIGRSDSVSYLPFVSSSGNAGKLVVNPKSLQQSYYQQTFAGDNDRSYAYAKNNYGTNGLISSSQGPGQSSATHPTLYEYRLNTSGEIRRYRMDTDGQSLYNAAGGYPAGFLTVMKTSQSGLPSDQQNESLVYVNSAGQTVAKAVKAGNLRRVTYYVYDDMGRQRYVIPPIQDSLITTTGRIQLSSLTMYSYYTEYDDHGRVMKQYVPGAEPVYSLYDKRGRLVMSQDGNQRSGNKWSVTKYDIHNRPVMTGVYTGGTFASHQTALKSQTVFDETRGTSLHGYTNRTYPSVSANNIYVVSYYDDYSWLGSGYAFSSSGAFSMPDYAVAGLVTGTKTKVLDVSPDQWLTSVTYYDSNYRSIQSISDLYPSGKEYVTNNHDFTGAVIQARVKQNVGTLTTQYTKWFEYDVRGRLVAVGQSIDGDMEVTIASYEYDDFGRVKIKHIHNNSEKTTYNYNVAGVNIGQHSASFSYDLWFDKVPSGSSLTPRHDGNMAHITWGGNPTGNQKAYTMSYDPFGQMTSALFKQSTNGKDWTTAGKFDEKGIRYDSNGNILALQRTSSTGAVTNLNYTYTGNRLTRINGGTAFRYDANGNMTYDGQTGVGIEYNILNLPRRVFANGAEIKYIYSARGEKLASQSGSSLTYYRSVMVYEKSGTGAEQLSYLLHPEGIVSKSSNAYIYRYFKTDHVGSTRAVRSSNKFYLRSGVDQTTDYYPFGLAHQLSNTNLNRYLYGSKELQNVALGSTVLGLYDFHARYYNPVLGRWFNIDPALQFTNPYLYAGNSPMLYVDKDGKIVWVIVAVVVGVYVGGVTQSGSWNPAKWDWSSGRLWAGMGIGAVAGLAGYGVGQFVMGGFAAAGTAGATVVQGGAISGMTSGAAAGATTGLINGSGQAWVGGASFLEGLGEGGKQALWGAGAGFVMGGAISGTTSAIKGNNFWTGVSNNVQPPLLPTTEPPTQTQQQAQPNADVPENSNLPQKYYPDNDGALGDWQQKTLKPGTIIDRYGKETGSFVSPEGTPLPARSLPPDAAINIYNKYEVLQPLPVNSSTVAPAFGQPGMGIQYRLPASVYELQQYNYIKPIK